MKSHIRALRTVWFLVVFLLTGNLFSQPLPGPAGPISGPPHVCRLDNGVTYSVDPIVNATGYTWALPAGVNLLTGAGTNTITVEFSASSVSGTISVYGTNASGSGSASYLNVTVNALPVPTITGLAQVCSGTSGVIYTTEPGMQNYTWTVSPGGTITSGTGTSMVIINWHTAGVQSIGVSYTNLSGCNAASPTVKTVNVLQSPSPTITGLTSVCQGSTGNAYITEPGMTGYTWTISQGGIISAGTGTNSVLVNWTGSGTQNLMVNYTSSNGCAATAPGTLIVSVTPFSPPTITGPSGVCVGTGGLTYTTESGMTGYSWNISPGGTITAGTGTNTVTVSWNSPGNQSISVNYTDPSGCSASSPTVKQVVVQSYSTPVITGSASVCAGSGGTPYATEPGMTGYVWSVSSGGTILSGTGTNSIIVAWTVAGPQNVSVSYTNPGGCTLPIPTVKNVMVLASPTPTITGLSAVCPGTSGVTYTTEAGMTGYTWTLSGGTITSGSGTNSITVTWNTPGTQSVGVNYTNAGGCSAGTPTTKTVTVYAAAAPSITGSTSACVGTSGVTYSTEGGMSGYTWTVSSGGTITGGAGTQMITVTWNNAGNQTVSVNYFTPDGCSASSPAVKQVNVSALPVPTITGSASACAGSTGVTYSTEPGMQNYIWNVSAGGTITQGTGTNTIKVTWTLVGPQSVTVHYTSPAGCPAASVAVKNVTVNPLPLPTITGTDAICAGSSGIVYATESGMTGYSWSISSGGTITSGSGTSSVTVAWNTAGNHTLTVNYFTPAGCSAASPATKNVTVYARPVPIISGNSSSCAGTSGVVYTTESGMTGYSWSISSGGVITAGMGTNAVTVTWNNPGPQSLSVNYINASGCTAAAPSVKAVTVNALPVPSIAGPSNACMDTLGNTFTTESGMTGYTWSVSPGGTIVSGSGTNTIKVIWSATGSQSVSVYYTNLNGCTASIITVKTVTVHPLPIPSLTGTASLCAGSAGITYSTEAGMTGYTWSLTPGGTITGGGNTHTATVNWNAPGNQTVYVNYTNTNGCRANVPAQMAVNVLQLPVPSISGPDSLCAGTVGITYLTEAGMSGYNWTVSAGGTITTGQGTSAIMVSWNTSGNQTISVSYTNPSGCTASSPSVKTIRVHANPVPVISGSDSLCQGSSVVQYTTQSGMTAYSWSISSGGTISSGTGTNSILVNWTGSGNQAVSVGYTNPKGCTSVTPSTKPINVHPLPVPIIIGSDSLCVGSSGIIYTTEAGMTDYSWTVSAGGTITSGAGTNAVTVTWNLIGTHNISVTYKTPKGCSPVNPALKTVRVFLRPVPTITGSDSLCAGSSGILYTTEPGMSNYTWTISSGGTITSGSGTNSITVSWNTAGNQTVTVNYANTKGCMALQPASKTIRVLPLPVPVISGSDSLCIGSTGVTYTTQTGMTGYFWTISPGGIITSLPNTHTVTVDWNTSGNQWISLTYVNQKGCIPATPAQKTVRIHPLPLPSIIGPDSICAGSSGNVYYTQTGMTAYMWSVTGGNIISGAGTHQVLVNWNSPGNQTISVTYISSKGCQAAAPAIKTIRVFPVPLPVISGSDSICSGTSGVVYSTEPGMNGYTWNISSGGTITGGLGTPAITVNWNTPGTQSLSVVYISPKGCLTNIPGTKTIQVFPLPLPTIAGPESICAATAGITYATEPGMTGYTWSLSAGGTITAGQGTNIVTVTWTTPGSQAISVYYTNKKGCTANVPAIKTIQVLPLPVPSINGPSTACVGTPEVIYSTQPGMLVYLWAVSAGGSIVKGQGTDSIYVQWNTPGVQSVSVNYTNILGCSGALPTSRTILVNPPPVPTISGPDSLCKGSSNILYTTESGMTGYIWSVSPGGTINGSTGSPVVSVTWNSSGDQWVKVNYVNANGCTALTPATRNVRVHPLPVPSISGSDSLCSGSTGIVYSTENGKSGYSWTISPGGTITSGSGTDSIIVSWNTAGNQSVSVSYLNEKGCAPASPATHPVTVHPLPVPFISGSTNLCLGTGVTIYSTQPGMTDYLWTVSAGGTILTGQGTDSVHIAWNSAGIQTISVNYKNSKGCVAPAPTSKTVHVNPLPMPILTGIDSLCAGSTGLIYTTDPGMTGYSWTVSPGGVITSGSSASLVTVDWPVPGNHWISVNYVNSNGCTAATPALREVTVHAIPVPALAGPDSVCADSLLYTYTTESGMNNYNWTVSPGGTIISGTGTSTIQVAWHTPGNQYVTVNYTSSKGCPASAPVQLNVSVHALPNPNISGPDTLCNGSAGIIYQTATGMSNYQWSISPGGNIVSGAGTSEITVNWTGSGIQWIRVNYKNDRGCFALQPGQLDVVIHPYPIPSVSGPASVCKGDTGIIYYTEPGMSAYNWSITPGGLITSGSGTDSVTVSWNTSGAQAIAVSYTSQQGCPTASPVTQGITVHNPPVPAITGSSSACEGSTGVTYSTEAGMTGYVWTVSPEGTITSGAGTSVVTVSWNTPGNASISADYTNPAGCNAFSPTIKNVVVHPLPVPTITGTAAICVNGTGSYSTETGMTGYQWSVSSGGVITSGSGTSTIQVQWTTAGAKTVSVTYTSTTGCAAAAPATYPVTVYSLPVPTITGNISLCAGSTNVLYITESGMTAYTWTVTAGGTIVGGQGTDSLYVNWNSAGIQVVSVTYTNPGGCNPIVPTNLSVTVNPVPLPSVSGNTQVCQGSSYIYSSQTGQTNYLWDVSPGGTIASGQGTSSATIVWNDQGSQWVSVTYTSQAGCQAASPDTLMVWVNPLPGTPGAINGDNEICAPSAWVQYGIDPVPNALNYVWSFPPGAVITAGQNTNIVYVTFTPGAVSGDASVYATNACGDGQPGPPMFITVHPTPPAPVIELFGADSLVSGSPAGNQWYLNGTAIPGAVMPYHIAQHSGNYTAVVTTDGCISGTSNNIYIIITGNMDPEGENLMIYPNPADLAIRVSSPMVLMEVVIFNQIGQTVLTQKPFSKEVILDVGKLIGGIYLIKIKTAGGVVVKRIMIE